MTCSNKHLVLIDSGIGGLTTLQLIARHFTNLEFTYIADKYYYPYTEKTDDQLKQRLYRLVSYVEKNYAPDLIVIACNTAATLALPYLQQNAAVPLVGVYPALERAAAMTQTKKIALLATPATLARDFIQHSIARLESDLGVSTIQLGSLELIELAERKLSVGKAKLSDIASIIKPLFTEPDHRQIDKPVDIAVLGCTHFPWLVEEFEFAARQAQQKIHWLDSNELIIDELTQIIPHHFSDPGFDHCLLYKAFLVTSARTDSGAISPILAKNLKDMGFVESKEVVV